ncbi:MAG: hypothetical protein MAG431_00690 [Chloroflexi bacterium]|nr:hypothetical protein [Chloroflexota bacterium]
MRSKHSGDAADWLNYARSDLELAQMNESPRVLMNTKMRSIWRKCFCNGRKGL